MASSRACATPIRNGGPTAGRSWCWARGVRRVRWWQASTHKGRRKFASPIARSTRRRLSRPLSDASPVDVRIFEEPKIDCHVHVLDPARFPYQTNTHYAPTGQEIGTASQLAQVMDAYGTRYALLVGPNSGYGLDNSCLLDTIAHGQGRYKGVAVVRNDASFDELEKLKRAGVLGVAWNVTHYGVDYYHDAAPLLEKL